MAKFNEYPQKATPEDADTLMIYDAVAKANKLSPFSGIWKWIVGKLTNAVISNLQTSNQTVLGAINELNSNSSGLKFIDAGIITQAEAQSADQAAQIVFDNKIPVSEGIIVFVNFIFAFRYSMIVQKYERGDYGADILFGCNVPTLTYHTKTAGTWN